MSKKNISFNTEINSFLNFEIINCYRRFENFDIDSTNDNLTQEKDGITYLVFNNNQVIIFYPNSERFSIDYKLSDISCINSDLKEITSNKFWKNLVNQKIETIKNLFSESKIPYGIRFIFKNNLKLDIVYISESEIEFDALVIR